MSDALDLYLALFGFVGIAMALMLGVSLLALAIGGPIVLGWRLIRGKPT